MSPTWDSHVLGAILGSVSGPLSGLRLRGLLKRRISD